MDWIVLGVGELIILGFSDCCCLRCLLKVGEFDLIEYKCFELIFE